MGSVSDGEQEALAPASGVLLLRLPQTVLVPIGAGGAPQKHGMKGHCSLLRGELVVGPAPPKAPILMPLDPRPEPASDCNVRKLLHLYRQHGPHGLGAAVSVVQCRRRVQTSPEADYPLLHSGELMPRPCDSSYHE